MVATKDNERQQSGITDEALILRVGDGDRTAYKILMDRHLRMNLAFATRLLGNPHEAEDVMQEAFVRVWKHAANWDPSRKTRFTTWFYRVVMNLCLDVKRKRRPSVDLSEATEVEGDEQAADGLLEEKQRAERVAEALDKLPERQRSAVILCYLQGKSNKEAAEILEVSVNALEALLVRGRRKLAEILSKEKGDLLEETG
ncbi:RNA polymerase sigma factor [Emcibacter nanhaiensis]|uniref:RNA polymerase sigma factor n=1 Tax=Emcibacter nanhaiensis TaxID=1505037 RepID=A0A501PI51_9PROT|nr:RNA polymerase sigma factor [Emcibacter nanhaiensis]TPD59748.1 RNA polymerase sigma factor [Emcibacter nanhaiensis]